jgi:hypothetical protein
MKRSIEINTSEISKRIKDVGDRLLGNHIELSASLKRGRLWITCLVCECQWAVVDEEQPSSGRDRFELKLTTDVDRYCDEGATNYFDSDGIVTRRM